MIAGILAIFSLSLLSFDISIFPEIKQGQNSIYVIAELEDERFISSGVFIMGNDFYTSLDVYHKSNQLFAVGNINSHELIEGMSYTLYLSYETDGNKHTAQYKLIALNGLLFSRHPPIPSFTIKHPAKHTVLKGEYIYKIARDYNLNRADLEMINPSIKKGIDPGDTIRLGRVEFESTTFSILITRDQNTLELFYLDRKIAAFPVALGRQKSTPQGVFRIKRKVKDPALYWKGEYIKPLSPINGLGKWWLELSEPQYGIHGTNKPWEIGKSISHGCIRMYNKDVDFLQSIIPLGTEVVIK